MTTHENTSPVIDIDSVAPPPSYLPFTEPLVIKGLKVMAGISSIMGATLIFASPLAIIALITWVGDRYVGEVHPDSIWFVLTTFSKMGAICLAVLAVIGVISASIFVFSHGLNLYANRIVKMRAQVKLNMNGGLTGAPLGVFHRRIPKLKRNRQL
jgi:hypothetical protein